MQKNDYKIQLFFAPLQTNDITARQDFLEELEREFDTADNCVCNGNNNHNGMCKNLVDHAVYYPTLLRLAYECPFEDVRISCGNVLSKLENGGIRIPRRKFIGPSRFIANENCVQIYCTDKEAHMLFTDAFLMNGRTSHINQLLGYHGKYFSWFLQFESHLMRSNGPLPLDWRYYIGIMGAAQHQCANLIEECERMFLLEQGDPKWLNGLEHIPTKLYKLNKINKLLAHQPWTISVELLKELLAGPAAETWSVSELIHAVVILVHFQTLSGFIYGCGVTPEIDTHKGHSKRSPSSGQYSSGAEPLTPIKVKANSLDSKPDGAGTTAVLFEKIQKVQLEEDQGLQADNEEEDEKLRQFQEVENKDLDESDVDLTNADISDGVYKRYVDDDLFHYQEFAKRENRNIDVFRAQDYSWQEHCFSFINRLYPEIGTLLEAKFQCTYNLTYNTMGDNITNVDTSKFRLATWNYIHLIYGIYHDDYVYYEVNKLLEKSYKSYIKKVSCFPECVTFMDYWDSCTDLLPSEKVHINLLVLESRLQAALLYASRCIMKYMK